MTSHHYARLRTDRDRLIADYQWLRRMMRHLEMQTERIDQKLTELEELLPEDYVHPNDPSERVQK